MKNIDIEIENDDIIFKLRVNGILINDKKILCVQMMKNGFFCLPGGHIEIGEDSKNAIIREIKEETKIDTEIVKLISITENFFIRNNGKKVHEISYYYLLSPKRELVIKNNEYEIVEVDKNEEIRHYFKWIDIHDLDNEEFRPIQIRDKIKKEDFNFEQIIIK